MNVQEGLLSLGPVVVQSRLVDFARNFDKHKWSMMNFGGKMTTHAVINNESM